MSEETTVEVEKDVHAGQATYTRLFLPLYDLLVLRFNFPVMWRCPKRYLLQLYEENMSPLHLDVGVGSGYLIDKCSTEAKSEITLMDLNPNSLQFAARRLRRYSPETHQANALEDWGLPNQAFDSVAMINLLHCLPGTLNDKSIVFENALSVMAPGGTLFGATVLGTDADHTKQSRRTMERLNNKGVFSNLDDRLEDLESGLSATFPTFQIDIQGAVALFTARTKST